MQWAETEINMDGAGPIIASSILPSAQPLFQQDHSICKGSIQPPPAPMVTEKFGSSKCCTQHYLWLHLVASSSKHPLDLKMLIRWVGWGWGPTVTPLSLLLPIISLPPFFHTQNLFPTPFFFLAFLPFLLGSLIVCMKLLYLKDHI